MSSQEDLTAVWEQRYTSLRETQRRLADTEENTRDVSVVSRAIVAQIGLQRFAILLGHVTEIVPYTTETPRASVPGAPPEFWGLVIVRGEVRPVFDLGRLLSIAGETAEGRAEDTEHLIFVRSGDVPKENEILGLKADRVEGIVRLSESDTMIPASEATTGRGQFVTRSVALSAEKPLLQIVDIPALLTFLRGGNEISEPADPLALSVTDVRSIEEE